MHHVFDVDDVVTLHSLVWAELKKRGIKEPGRARKPTKNAVDVTRKNIFGQPLELLDSDKALLMVETEAEDSSEDSPVYAKGDVLTKVPTFVIQCCQTILKNAHTEGVFRKAGSAARQRDIKRQLEKGEGIKASHDVVDLANILKQFLRDLPEPLIPYQLHEVLLKCLQLDDPAETFQTIHLTCLLIPATHLATLCYLLQFFEAVASKSSSNLMDVTNLSIVMAPTLMPLHLSAPKPRAGDRTDRQSCAKLHNYSKIIQLLIGNSSRLCGLPHYIANKLISISTPSLAGSVVAEMPIERSRRLSRDKKRHRRSSSFNRVFEGLRKMVVGKNDSLSATHSLSADHLLDIPTDGTNGRDNRPANSPVIRSQLKRKVDPLELAVLSGLSLKKKKAAADLNPVKVLCTTPLTPQGQHVNVTGHLYHFVSPHIDLNPSPSAPAGTTAPSDAHSSKSGVLRFFQKKKTTVDRSRDRNGDDPHAGVKTPKLPKRRLSLGRKSMKKTDQPPSANADIAESGAEEECKSAATGDPADAVDHPVSPPVQEETYQEVKERYEELKCQLDVLENELAGTEAVLPEESDDAETANAAAATPVSSLIQDEYQKTLEESEKLLLERSASEQLAQQMKRDLRIRRSADQRVIRSPSARKIGAIRRRSSKESPRPSITSVVNGVSPTTRRLTRSQSLLPSTRRSLVMTAVNSNPNQRTPTQSDTGSAQEVKSALRRGQPNTVRTGLKDPTPLRNSRRQSMHSRMPLETPNRRPVDPVRPVQEKRAIERTGSVLKLAQNFASVRTARVKTLETLDPTQDASLVTPEKWTSGELFHRQLDHLRAPLTGRPSVQKIRSENLGKVSACVRKFDGLNASPALPERRCSMTAVNESPSRGSPTTPATARAPRSNSTGTCPGRRPSTGYLQHQTLAARNSSPLVSPLRESQKANGVPVSTSRPAQPDPKIKAPLLTPCNGSATPHGLRLRQPEMRTKPRPKKPSPLKAVGSGPVRRSPRLAQTTSGPQ